MIKNFKWLLLVSLSFVACNNDDDNSDPVEVPITPGTTTLTKYVALGDSFAAGYSDGALFKAGQANSYGIYWRNNLFRLEALQLQRLLWWTMRVVFLMEGFRFFLNFRQDLFLMELGL